MVYWYVTRWCMYRSNYCGRLLASFCLDYWIVIGALLCDKFHLAFTDTTPYTSTLGQHPMPHSEATLLLCNTLALHWTHNWTSILTARTRFLENVLYHSNVPLWHQASTSINLFGDTLRTFDSLPFVKKMSLCSFQLLCSNLRLVICGELSFQVSHSCLELLLHCSTPIRWMVLVANVRIVPNVYFGHLSSWYYTHYVLFLLPAWKVTYRSNYLHVVNFFFGWYYTHLC